MAKFKKSQLFDKLSGPLEDIVLIDSDNYGSHLRTKANPKNKRTPAQVKVRNRHSDAARAWALVNPQQVEAWRAFALRHPYVNNVGVKVYHTNRSIFIKCNRSLLEIGQPVILDPPKNNSVQVFDSIEPDILVSDKFYDIKLHFKPAIKKNTKVIIFATAFLKPGVNSPKSNKYKEIAILDSSFINGSSILGSYNKIFPYQNYKSFKIAFKFKPVSAVSGFRSPETAVIELPQYI